MPELPEVETMRRGLEPIVGGTVVAIERGPCRRRPIAIEPSLPAFGRRAAGQLIQATGRIGKRVTLELSSGDSIVFEPRMTGLVLLADPPTQDHLRVRIRLSGRAAREVLYWDRRGLGSVRLLTPRQFAARFGPNKIGPDALQITQAEWRERLGASRRAIKVALLDQRAVAGIGNLYAAEILHQAGIDPRRPCTRLTRGDWTRIADACSEILSAAIRHEGSTLSDGTYRNALNLEGSYQNQHRVYDREGEKCTLCGRAAIRRIVQAQRATFYCPGCQKR